MNVFVLLADSWRYDHFGFTGNDWIKTPTIDALAEESFVFEQAYSGGLPTLPQRTECFTGRNMLKFRGWEPLQPQDDLISEVLWKEGYETALISDTWHLHEPKMAFARGFDTVRYIRGQEEDPCKRDYSFDKEPLHFKERPESSSDPFSIMNEHFKKQAIIYERNRAHFEKEDDYFCPQVIETSLEWLKKRKGRDDLFLWLDSFDPHEAWDPPAPYNRMYQPDYKGEDEWLHVPGMVDGYLSEDELNHVRALYAGLCTMVDKWFGIFLKQIKEWGFLDNTLIIFLSDHGEFFGNGKWGHGQIRKACVWPYEELAHIPLIIRHPEGIGAGKRSNAIVQCCDLAPTILDFLSLDGLPERHGESVLPIMNGKKQSLRDSAISGHYKGSWSIRDNNWMYMMYHKNKFGDWLMDVETGLEKSVSPPELYDRTQDPYELNNVIEAHPDVAKHLSAKLEAYMDKLQ